MLRAAGPWPDEPEEDERRVHVFGFEGQPGAVYLDRDAFVGAWTADTFLHVDTTFGSLQFAGPIERPDAF